MQTAIRSVPNADPKNRLKKDTALESMQGSSAKSAVIHIKTIAELINPREAGRTWMNSNLMMKIINEYQNIF